MRVIFRGVRGTLPWARADAMKFGCNTACLQITNEESGAHLLLDAGSGIAGARLGEAPGDVYLLITHYHWDHVLGLPFLPTLYEPGWKLRVLAPKLPDHDDHWLPSLFRAPFFPVPFSELLSPPLVSSFDDAVCVEGFQITTAPLKHPGGAIAYRIRGRHRDLVYATDHELGDPVFDDRLRALASGAGALVLDAHFTPEELPQYRGWGHSDWRTAAEFGGQCGVETLYLFHHKPGRTDGELLEIRERARGVFPDTEIAMEGAAFEL